MTAEEVEHACLVRDLAAAYDDFYYKGNGQWSARNILTEVALRKKLSHGSKSPAMIHIRKKYPLLWEQLQSYRKL